MENLTPECQDLLTRLLHKNPKKRLGSGEGGADEVISHPWFKKTKWEKVIAQTQKAPYRPRLDGEDDVCHFSEDFTA